MYLTLLEKNIKHGILHLHMPDGTTHTFGESGLEAHWHIRSEAALKRVARYWQFELGQTYMEGGWDVADGSLRDLLMVLRSNFRRPNPHDKRWYLPLVRALQQINKISSSYRNIAHHYDVDEFIFRRFLDREMFYSCAYFRDPANSLEQAQLDKAELIARKLLLKPGQTVLDIGCGWGSLAFYLAQHYDVEVVGITLSREQLRVARDEAARRGLTNVRFELADYREHASQYDRIVSVGMLEHVGVENFKTYFSRVRDMLKEDGVALIHSIGSQDVPKETNPWIEKYIFPGGRIPSLSEMSRGVEESMLMTTDVEALRLHYAETLKHWYERFQAARDEVKSVKGEEFCRMWEFYLTACESSFRHADLVVFQFQLAKEHGVVPITRDYLNQGQWPVAAKAEAGLTDREDIDIQAEVSAPDAEAQQTV